MSRGWYSISELDLNRLVDVLEMNDVEVENVMVSFVREKQEEFIGNACRLFPLREKILKTAFYAHENGLYELSIPVFLIQADGMSKEMFGESLYSKSSGKLKLSKEYDRLLEKFGSDKKNETILSPLTYITSINMNTDEYEAFREKDKFFSPLNRHEIIHGMNVEYNTVENSLRCVLLLEFLSEVKTKYIDHNSNTT